MVVPNIETLGSNRKAGKIDENISSEKARLDTSTFVLKFS
jgi:hypothetical protein